MSTGPAHGTQDTQPQRAEPITVSVTDTTTDTETGAETDTTQVQAASTATAELDWITVSWYAMGAVYAAVAGAVVVLEPLANAVAVAGILLLMAVYSAAFGRWSG